MCHSGAQKLQHTMSTMSEHEYPAAFVLLAYTFLVNQASHGLFFFFFQSTVELQLATLC